MEPKNNERSFLKSKSDSNTLVVFFGKFVLLFLARFGMDAAKFILTNRRRQSVL